MHSRMRLCRHPRVTKTFHHEDACVFQSESPRRHPCRFPQRGQADAPLRFTGQPPIPSTVRHRNNLTLQSNASPCSPLRVPTVEVCRVPTARVYDPRGSPFPVFHQLDICRQPWLEDLRTSPLARFVDTPARIPGGPIPPPVAPFIGTQYTCQHPPTSCL